MLPFDIRHSSRDADYGLILTGKNFIRQQKRSQELPFAISGFLVPVSRI
jgi:hypothetical protein